MIPIIAAGQVYLSPINEYVVVTYSNQGQIKYKGKGMAGVRDISTFREFLPVDPADLLPDEVEMLRCFVSVDLRVGWIWEDGEYEEEETGEEV